MAERMAGYLRREGLDLGVVYLEGLHTLSEARHIRRQFEDAADAAFYLEHTACMSLDALLQVHKQKELSQEEQRRLHNLRKEITVALSHADRESCFAGAEEYLRICSGANPRIFRNSVSRLYSHINDELVIENEELTRQHPAMRFQGKTVAQLAQEADHDADIRQGVYQYLEAILSWYCSLQENANYRVVMFVEDYIEKHYMEPVSVEKMAEQIGLSPNYVRSIFKNGNGMTIKNYLSEYRMDKACRLLKNTSARVSQIASQVGYDNVSYFCAVFQKRFGKTPNEWRRGL